MWRRLIFFSFIAITSFEYIMSLEVTPERAVVQYYNPKYVAFLNVSARRAARRKPYALNVHARSLITGDNNLTVRVDLLELVSSGRYQVTPLQVESKVCDFLSKDRYLGNQIGRMLNVTCPIPMGEYHFTNMMLDFSNFPYHVPFSWAHQAATHTRADMHVFTTDTKETIFKMTLYFLMTQN